MSLKQGIILWVSGSLTAFIIVGIFWTVFRTELDAARSLVIKADATFEQAEQALREVKRMSTQLDRNITTMSEKFHSDVDQMARKMERGREDLANRTHREMEGLLGGFAQRIDEMFGKLQLQTEKMCQQAGQEVPTAQGAAGQNPVPPAEAE